MGNDNARLFASSTADPAGDAAKQIDPAEAIDRDGVAIMRDGSVYFGHLVSPANATTLKVIVPTPEGKVGSVRFVELEQIEEIKELPKPSILALAKLGSYLLTKDEYEEAEKKFPPVRSASGKSPSKDAGNAPA